MNRTLVTLVLVNLMLVAAVLTLQLSHRSASDCESAQRRAALAWQAVAMAELGYAIDDIAYDMPTTNATEVAAAHAAGEWELASTRAQGLPFGRGEELIARVEQVTEVLGDSPRRIELARQATERATAACQ